MRTTIQDVRSIAIQLATDEARKFKKSDFQKAKDAVIRKHINTHVIEDRISNPIQVQRILNHRTRTLRKELRAEIKDRASAVRESRTNRLIEQLSNDLKLELQDLQRRINLASETSEHLLKVCNCQLLHRVGPNPEEVTAEYIKSQAMTVAEFEALVNSGRLIGFREAGVVYGYLDLTDVQLEDFDHEGLITVQAGPGITATIDRDVFLETVTHGRGNDQIQDYISSTEIKYGRQLEASCHQSPADTEEDEAQIVNLEYRAYEETRYWKDHYLTKIEQAQSLKDLFDAAVGVLFPIQKDGKLLWTRPLNCISAEGRKKLLARYHDRVSEIQEQRQDLLEKVVKWSNDSTANLSKMLRCLSPHEAKEVLIQASNHRKKTGEALLSKKAWWLLNQHISGNQGKLIQLPRPRSERVLKKAA